jgi:hypothetical protein
MIRFLGAVLFSLLVMASLVDAAKYYVDNSAADDAGNGSIGSPKKYIPSGIALMSASGGDSCIIIDGTYSGASNDITTFKAGTSGAYNTIMAQNDGGAVISSSVSVSTTTSMYTNVIGLKFNSATSKEIYQRYVKFFRCAFVNGQTCSSNCAGATNTSVGSYQLYEDCWFYGVGGRYTVMAYQESHTVFRRCVARHESGGYTFDGSNPEACWANYEAAYMVYENCIAIDNTLTYSAYQGDFYCTGHGGSGFNSTGTVFIGCIALLGQNASWYCDTDDGATSMTWTDCVGYSNTGGVVIGNTGVPATVTRVTIGDQAADGIGLWSGSMTIINSIVFNHGTTSGGNPTISYCNTYNPSSYSGTGVTHTDPTTIGLSYFTRIEDGSTLKTAGSSGGQVGAQIVYKVGADGTLYGESGYATVTENALWPWPNEARIKSDMATVPTVGARGFCTGNGMDGQSQSLTRYIWEQLGNQYPSEVTRHSCVITIVR